MPKTVTLPAADNIKNAYGGSGQKASTRYAAKIALVTDWFSKATSDAAEANYSARMAFVLANKLRAKGITNKTSNEAWKSAAQTKGAPTLATRISLAADKQSKNWAPYYAALNGLSIPDKVPGDPIGNLTRNAGAVVATLANVKRAQEGLPAIPVPK
jgi:hypothetical protein